MKFIFAILCLVVVSDKGLAQICNIDAIQQCLHELREIAAKMVIIKNADGKDVNNFCSTLNPEPKCVKDIPQICKDEFSVYSGWILRAQLYMNEFCGENGKMYRDVAPCISSTYLHFNFCPQNMLSSPDADACAFVNVRLCMAKFFKYYCKDGEAYGNALEKRMKILKPAVCRLQDNEFNLQADVYSLKTDVHSLKADVYSGASFLANSFWTFALTILSALLMRNKLQ